MSIKEIYQNRAKRDEQLSQKFSITDDNPVLKEVEGKYEIFRDLRMRLGKSEKEFQKIFELYYHLLSQNNQ